MSTVMPEANLTVDSGLMNCWVCSLAAVLIRCRLPSNLASLWPGSPYCSWFVMFCAASFHPHLINVWWEWDCFPGRLPLVHIWQWGDKSWVIVGPLLLPSLWDLHQANSISHLQLVVLVMGVFFIGNMSCPQDALL